MDHADWSTWSNAIDQLRFFFPIGTYLPKRFTALGLDMTVLGLLLSSTARDWLCSWPLQFLGKYSFAVYLTHGTILKTVLIWMIYGTSGQPWDEHRKDEKGENLDPIPLPRCGKAGFVFWVPVWVVLVYCVAWLWTNYVDAWCEKVSQWLLRKTLEEDEKSLAGPNMA
ncbi:MAG: hypothetical protein MMC23_007085 [Stictis urceolatum]|nr:hypothetical protein [Stictis urceolata]